MEIVVRLSLVRLLKYNAVVSPLSPNGGRLSEGRARIHLFSLVVLVLVDRVITLHRPNIIRIKHIVTDLPHQRCVHAELRRPINWSV
jgi:hypothetical protein